MECLPSGVEGLDKARGEGRKFGGQDLCDRQMKAGRKESYSRCSAAEPETTLGEDLGGQNERR